MEVMQLQLDLWQSLETAARFPETADVRSLCAVLEKAMVDQPLSEQLQIGSDAISRLADVFAARAEWMISGWEYQHHPQEPVVDLEDYAELFVQSLHLDVSELFEQPASVHYPEYRRSPYSVEQSLAGEVDKAVLLHLVDELEWGEAELTQQVQELAHDEPIGEWVDAIRVFLSQQPSGCAVSFVELVRSLDLEKVEVWLGLLHGRENWQLQQNGSFYDRKGILVLAG